MIETETLLNKIDSILNLPKGPTSSIKPPIHLIKKYTSGTPIKSEILNSDYIEKSIYTTLPTLARYSNPIDNDLQYLQNKLKDIQA